jgi:predicted ATPase
MLERLRLTDWKSFVDEEVELAPLTLLVGANASGKSNFLDAIRFIHLTVELYLTAADALDGEKSSRVGRWEGLRGGSGEAARVGTTRFAIDSTWRTAGAETYELHAACWTSPRVLMEPGSPWERPEHHIHFLDIQPRRMRGYGKRGSPLGEDGSNISGVLAELCDDPAEKQAIVDWLRELCAPEIVDLDFIEVRELGDVMAIFVEHGGKRISARSLSDGTLRFLGTLVALRTAQPGSVLLIEEIEAELHPTRIRLLVEYLQAVARERDVQIIATTHSPVVLEWLDEAALASAIVFGRVPDREGTLMRRLGDLPHFREVVQKKGIEELFTTGWLEMAL